MAVADSSWQSEVFTPSCLDMLNDIMEPADDFLGQDSLGAESSFLEVATGDTSALFDFNPRLLSTAQNALKASQLVAVPQVTRVLTSRLQYAMDKIMAAPFQMVSENHMPWCHAHLYDGGMPRSIQCGLTSSYATPSPSHK